MKQLKGKASPETNLLTEYTGARLESSKLTCEKEGQLTATVSTGEEEAARLQFWMREEMELLVLDTRREMEDDADGRCWEGEDSSR